MRAGYSSETPVSELTTVHAIAGLVVRRERSLYCGTTTLSGTSMIGLFVGETESSLLSGGMKCGVGELYMLGVTLVCGTG